MFVPLHQMARIRSLESSASRKRWDSPDGMRVHNLVMAEMRANAREHFLEIPFDRGQLNMLERHTDLRGITIFQENIMCPRDDDNFKGTDFSFGSFYHCVFDGASFMSSSFAEAELYNCEFRDCIFQFLDFSWARIRKSRFINCEFQEGSRFVNCDFESAAFVGCFFFEPTFVDCRFDTGTSITSLQQACSRTQLTTEARSLTKLYPGIRQAYDAGQVTHMTRHYYFLERQSATRYATTSRRQRILEFCWELLAGYGTRPLWIVRAMCLWLVVAWIAFAPAIGLLPGLRLAAGAFFTFGAGAEVLPSLSLILQLFYVLTAFIGVSLTALLVTVLASVYVRFH